MEQKAESLMCEGSMRRNLSKLDKLAGINLHTNIYLMMSNFIHLFLTFAVFLEGYQSDMVCTVLVECFSD